MVTTRRRTSLATRTVLMTSAVAAIVVLVAGLVSYPLVRASALTQTQGPLARLADLTTAALDRGPQIEQGPKIVRGSQTNGASQDRRRNELLPRSLSETLRVEKVSGYYVEPGAVLPPGMTDGQVADLIAKQTLSTEAPTPQGDVLIEGRVLANGGAVVLQQPTTVVGGSALAVILRLSAALVVGLLIAIPMGYLVARRMTRPLRAARDAANIMATGSRDVWLKPAGPSEIADIAVSLNYLNSALNISEGRQREFLMSVSHEFRTPLTAVKGYAEALADGVVADGDVARTGSTMGAEAQRLDRLVSDLLDLARLGAVSFRMNPVDTDLALIGEEASEVWMDRCSRVGVTFVPDMPSFPIAVTTDPMRVRQIIDNLLENALRVSPSGSTIVLSLRAEGDWAVVEVRDSGPGLTDDDMGVAFEPGVLHERYRGVRPVGTGLGLALVGRLAAGLGGFAQVGAAAEGGARFTVRLPA
ncbi:unannotated protein [freshwater metagenome]|uniref:Signal transduction histidine-protein kinase/phosphatase MprB n=1 Tax=freshwater metagenome TaxID=449393 RepID=A0A6J7D1G2_9ZZZZ